MVISASKITVFTSRRYASELYTVAVSPSANLSAGVCVSQVGDRTRKLNITHNIETQE